jgi:hypothetical protein
MRVVAIAAGAMLLLWSALSLIFWSISKQTVGCALIGIGLMVYGLRSPRD